MKTNKAIIQWIWHATRGNRLQATLNAMIGVTQVVASLASVWAMKNAIDIASGVKDGSVYMAVGLMGCIILCDFALGISSVWVRNILGVKAQNRMQQQMLDRLLRSEWTGKETFHSGDVLNRLELDVRNVVTFITETLPSTLSTLLLFFGAFSYLFMLDNTLALMTIAIVPLCVVLSKVYVKKMRRLNRSVRDSDSEIQALLQETIQHRMLIKTLEGDDMMIGKLETSQQTLRHRVIRRTLFGVLSRLILNFGFAGTYLLAFLWSALRMAGGTLTFGGMTAFLQLVNRIQSPARDLSKLIPAFVSVLTAAERLMELEQIPREEQGQPLALAAPCGIALQNVTYAYPDALDEKVISDLSFVFKPGTATAIVGETGAGKTTLIRIILALLKPTEGCVSIMSGGAADDAMTSGISGEQCQEMSPRHRCNLVYVPQGNTLLSGTIRENLLMGKPEATEAELVEALRKSCADFVLTLPEGLDTQCTERGGGLSEGQAQRIAIARALLRDRPVMLFDEATSALDPDTERQLLHNILSKHDKTVIFITHRMAVCDYCDDVLKL